MMDACISGDGTSDIQDSSRSWSIAMQSETGCRLAPICCDDLVGRDENKPL